MPGPVYEEPPSRSDVSADSVRSPTVLQPSAQVAIPCWAAVLSATTFCSFLREFSPLEVCAG